MSAVLSPSAGLQQKRGLLLGTRGWIGVITALAVICVAFPVLNLMVPGAAGATTGQLARDGAAAGSAHRDAQPLAGGRVAAMCRRTQTIQPVARGMLARGGREGRCLRCLSIELDSSRCR